MAFMTPASWNVMTTGNDLNGGGFVVGQAGTDYSLNAAANSAGSNISTTDAVANGTTTLTSATGAFTSAIVGNIIYLTGGSGSLAAVRRGVVSLTNATTIVLDTAVAAGTGITMNIGGACASPGGAAQFHITGNTINVKTGTYTVTTATVNVAVGCLSLIAGTAGNGTKLIGYNTTYGDLANVNSSANRPLLQASAISAFSLVTSSTGGVYIENIALDGATLTTSRGFLATSNTILYRCKASNCTNSCFSGSSTTTFLLCEAYTATVAGAGFLAGNGYGCYATTCSVPGYSAGTWDYSIATSNTSHGFNTNGVSAEWTNCIAYANGGDGFSLSASNTVTVNAINCIAANNTGAGYKGVAPMDGARFMNCATYLNTGGTFINLSAANQYVNIAISVTPFVNAAGGDFSLNNNGGGGALCRAAGLVGAFPGLSISSKQDVGVFQHADPIKFRSRLGDGR